MKKFCIPWSKLKKILLAILILAAVSCGIFFAVAGGLVAGILGLATVFRFTVDLELPWDQVSASLGEYENREFFSSGEFQDYTYYAKYYYIQADLSENAYLDKIQENDLENFHRHLEDFEGWLRTLGEKDEVTANYDFDPAIIDGEDYIYIDSQEHTWSDGHTSLTDYDVFFFDTQTQVLYYFHNNI